SRLGNQWTQEHHHDRTPNPGHPNLRPAGLVAAPACQPGRARVLLDHVADRALRLLWRPTDHQRLAAATALGRRRTDNGRVPDLPELPDWILRAVDVRGDPAVPRWLGARPSGGVRQPPHGAVAGVGPAAVLSPLLLVCGRHLASPGSLLPLAGLARLQSRTPARRSQG